MPNDGSITILAASHKPYDFPGSPIYLPVQVGTALNGAIPGMMHDDGGEHISGKNASFCELTALYWAWKNRVFDESAYAGLVHYRRYFAGTLPFGKHRILSEEETGQLLRTCDVIVPKKRCYYIETVRDHYAHAHYAKDLDSVRQILAERAPEYLEAFDSVMGRRSLHLYNMFLMRTERFYAYCEWLFPLLFEAEKRIDVSGYDAYQRRVFGFLAERLFNVWLLQNGLKTHAVKIVNIEGENLLKKGVMMLKRKWLR